MPQTVEQRAEYLKALVVEKGYAVARGDVVKAAEIDVELAAASASARTPADGATRRGGRL